MTNKPAANFARHVQKLPDLKKQVYQALSNQFGQNSQNDLPVYQIHLFNVYYKGPWKNSLPNGKGVCIYPDGTYYQGHFIDGQPNDEDGLLILSNGAAYKGNIENSKINGKGAMRHNLGNQQIYIYQGDWKDGKPHGKGRQKYGDGSEYQGYYLNGYKHCINESISIEQKKRQFQNQGVLSKQSRYRSKQGEVYNGQFKNGLMHGFGEYVNHSKNIKYVGQFNHGKKKGHGSLVTKIGKLTGTFQNDVINGKGEFHWFADNKTYKGEFERNQPHGHGRIQLSNGNVLQGTWEQGHNVKLTAIASINESRFNQN